MPKLISKSKLKLKLGTDFSAIDELAKTLTGDPSFTGDIPTIYSRATEFNGYLKTYMMTRFNMGKTISNAYTEAGTRLVSDNQLIITPIKTYLRTIDITSKKFIGTLEEDKLAIQEFKKTYLDFKKSKVVLDAIVICNNITDFDFENKTYINICEEDYNLTPFKTIPEYESEKLNLKFIMIDEYLSPELKTELYEELKTLKSVTSNLHNMYNTPDINIEDIFPKLMDLFDNMLGDLKGCKEAKKLLKSSSSLFTANFGNYFKNFQVTESPFGILEDFITDIVTKEKNSENFNPKLLVELSTIMCTLKKKLNKNKNIMANPQFSKAINMVETALHNLSNVKDKPDNQTEEDVQKNFEEVVNFLSTMTGSDFNMPSQSENNTNL